MIRNGYWAVFTDLSFRIKGCRITLSYYFFAMTAAMVILCRDWLFFCGTVAAAVHELGHIAVIALCRESHVREVYIGALGVKMTACGITDRPIIITAGVLANLAVSLLCIPFLFWSSCRTAALPLLTADLCLALCNILPIEPLDGGLLLRFLLERRLSSGATDRAAFIISLCTMLPLTTAALFAVMQSGGNFSLLILCLWLFAGILKRYV